MKEFPLLFTFRDMVAGNGFIAGVTISGRALMTDEGEGGWWVYGVRPGALSESGDTPQAAYLAFRTALQETLFHFAERSADFFALHADIERFFGQVDAEEERRWVSAREAIKGGAAVDAPFTELPQDRSLRPCFVEVVRLDKPERQPTPADNRVEEVGIANANLGRVA